MQNLVVLLGGCVVGLGMVAIVVRVKAVGGWSGVKEKSQSLLRRINVVTAFSLAGLVLSAAGLCIVIGIGRVQISASNGGSGDLNGDHWFQVGLALGSVALLLGCVAISANTSQSHARSEFPNVTTRFNAFNQNLTSVDVPLPSGPGGATIKARVFGFDMTFINHETDRYLSLWIRVIVSAKPAASIGVPEFGLTSASYDAQAMTKLIGHLLPARPLIQPVDLSPGTLKQGQLHFEAWTPFDVAIDETVTPRIVIVDQFSERFISFPAAVGTYDSMGKRIA